MTHSNPNAFKNTVGLECEGDRQDVWTLFIGDEHTTPGVIEDEIKEQRRKGRTMEAIYLGANESHKAPFWFSDPKIVMMVNKYPIQRMYLEVSSLDYLSSLPYKSLEVSTNILVVSDPLILCGHYPCLQWVDFIKFVIPGFGYYWFDVENRYFTPDDHPYFAQDTPFITAE